MLTTRAALFSVLALWGIAALSAAHHARADEAPAEEAPAEEAPAAARKQPLFPLASEILKAAKKTGAASVAIGEFVGPAGADANCGAGLGRQLREMLEKLQPGLVQRRGDLSVRGRYDDVPDPLDPEVKVVRVTAELTDRQAETVARPTAEVRDNAQIATLLGLTVALPGNGTAKQRNQVWQQRLDSPQFAPDQGQTRVRAKAGSPFAVEVLVTRQSTAPKTAAGWNAIAPRPAKNVAGHAYVDIALGEVYALRLINDGENEAAVALAIDGLDAFTFSELRDPVTQAPASSHYVVAPRGAQGHALFEPVFEWRRRVDVWA